jgi:hypothetical protein
MSLVFTVLTFLDRRSSKLASRFQSQIKSVLNFKYCIRSLVFSSVQLVGRKKLKFFLFMYVFQHCFTCRPSNFTVSQDDEIEPSTVATLALTARRSHHLARSHPHLLIFTARFKIYIFYFFRHNRPPSTSYKSSCSINRGHRERFRLQVRSWNYLIT